MIAPITRNEVLLRFAPGVVKEIDAVIDQNLKQPSLVALFISRLLKGFQNLTNEDLPVDSVWGNHSYVIEDIGTVDFLVFKDSVTGQTAIAVEDIRWSFFNSRFFSSFEV